MKFKYLIIDDEPLARKLIITHASKIEGLEFSGECTNPLEASNFMRNKKVDLIFLDIQMPEMNGLNFIHTLTHKPPVIVTTAFRDFGPEAFELNVIDYLLKPVRFERLLTAVNKFFEHQTIPSRPKYQHEEEAFVYLRADRKMHKIPTGEILYIESLDEYVKVYLRNKMIITREGISLIEQRLPNEKFVRIHRSFIVATKAVTSVGPDGVEISGKILPFGRAFKQSALAGLKIKV